MYLLKEGFFFFTCFNLVLSILFPTSDTISWSPLHPSEIVCAGNPRTIGVKGATRIPGYLPVMKHAYTIKGFICESVTLSVKCTKGFFGGIDLTYIEDHHRIKHSDCVEAVTMRKRGHLEIKTYPPHDCVWLETNTKSNTFIGIVETEMILDPYSGSIISELFPGNKCKASYCETIYEHRAWVSDASHHPDCVSDHLNTALFYAKTHKGGLIDFWSPDFNVPNGQKICMMSFCGMEGILFHDGSWIGVNSGDIPRDDSALGDYLMRMPLCPNGTVLTQLEGHHSVHVAEKSILEKFFELECEKTKESLLLKQVVSRVNLQSLNPLTPGIHKVYRFVNHTIQMGVSYYQDVDLLPPISSNPAVALTKDGKIIKWKYWTYDETSNIMDGPNGLFISNGSVRSYITDIDSYQRSVALSLNIKVQIQSPTSYHKIPKLKTANSIYVYTSNKAGSLDSWFHKMTQSFWWVIVKWIMIFSSPVVLIISIYMTLRCLFGYVNAKVKRARDNIDSIPMVVYRPK